jgi:hypothetical protein
MAVHHNVECCSPMQRKSPIRALRLIVVAGALAALPGCASSPAGRSTGPANVVLQGEYEAHVDGPIRAVKFDHDRYAILRGDCDADLLNALVCVDTGTFRIDDAESTVTLTKDGTEETTTLALQVLQAASEMSESALHTSAIIGAGVDLVATPTVQRMRLSGETVELVSSQCSHQVRTITDPAATLAHFKDVATNAGGYLSGTAKGGSFAANGFAGTYTVSGNRLEVNMTKMPGWVPCFLVDNYGF